MLKSGKHKMSVLLVMAMLFSLGLSGAALAAEPPFADVPADAWYAEAVAYVQEQGLMNGNTPTEFAPEENLTRAMLVTVLYRLEGEPAVSGDDGFSDTAAGQWYSDAVLWATQRGVVNGYGEGLFGTNDNITRKQLAAVLWRYSGSQASAVTKPYADYTEVSAYATAAVNWAAEQGIMRSVSGDNWQPQSLATRAQAAEALMNMAVLAATAPLQEGAEPKVLVAYFSATNNTENIAKHIAAVLGADIYEIVPESPYTAEDLNYGDNSSRATQEQNNAAARPAISGSLENLADYEVIFLGYPIWWGQAPRIISTFLESYDFAGKTIVPFCTSGSSSMGSSAANLQGLTKGASWLEGRRFSGSAAQTEVAAWLNGLNLAVEK